MACIPVAPKISYQIIPESKSHQVQILANWNRIIPRFCKWSASILPDLMYFSNEIGGRIYVKENRHISGTVFI